MNTKNGFIGLLPLLAIIAVFVVAAGGTYFYLQHHNPAPHFVLTEPEATTTLGAHDGDMSISDTYLNAGPAAGSPPLTVSFPDLDNGCAFESELAFGDGQKISNGLSGWPRDGVSHTYSSPGTYTASLRCDAPDQQNNAKTITISVAPSTTTLLSKSNAPMATIDQGSLTTTSSTQTPIITGTVSGTPSISVEVGGSWGLSSDRGGITISNGHWSTRTYSEPEDSPFPLGTYKVAVFDNVSQKVLTTGTLTVTGVSGMSKYTDTNLGITFYAPPGLQTKVASTNGVPSNFDYCVSMINPSDINKNYQGDDGNWLTLCKKQTSMFVEEGYWGDTVYYYFDSANNQWMYARHGTGADDPGGTSTATTTATVEARALAGDPIFVGTGAHSCISRIVPISENTFIYVRDRFCSDYDSTSFESAVAQTFDRIGHTPDPPTLQTALQNELAAIAKFSH